MMIKKLALLFVCTFTLMFQSKEIITYDNIQTSFNDSYQIELIKDNKSYYFQKDNDIYYKILSKFNEMIVGSHQMPSLGVSLDYETRKAKEKGIWLEFSFDNVGYNSDMPFEALLIEVNKGYYGFNVIRKHNGKYEGRTYYITLIDTNMNKLYEYLNKKINLVD